MHSGNLSTTTEANIPGASYLHCSKEMLVNSMSSSSALRYFQVLLSNILDVLHGKGHD